MKYLYRIETRISDVDHSISWNAYLKLKPIPFDQQIKEGEGVYVNGLYLGKVKGIGREFGVASLSDTKEVKPVTRLSLETSLSVERITKTVREFRKTPLVDCVDSMKLGKSLEEKVGDEDEG